MRSYPWSSSSSYSYANSILAVSQSLLALIFFYTAAGQDVYLCYLGTGLRYRTGHAITETRCWLPASRLSSAVLFRPAAGKEANEALELALNNTTTVSSSQLLAAFTM